MLTLLKAAFSQTPLTTIIKKEIDESAQKGLLDNGTKLSAISFHKYMTLCLYHHEFGYYRSGKPRVGRDGDFYTSAYVGELMGEQLASELIRLAEQWFPEADIIEVIDWGGGTGRLSRQMLDAWNANSHRFRLTLVDGNPEHRRTAFKELDTYIRKGLARVVDSDEGERTALGEHPVILIANELLDAFPVCRLVYRDGQLWEWGVAWDEAMGRFIPCKLELSDPRYLKWLKEEEITLHDNQTFEMGWDAAAWVKNLASRMDRAILMFIDYGDMTAELIAPHRMDGTLLCYYNHRAHNDPYMFPGEQDITSHVNFSHILRSVQEAGWRELWFGSQKKFLLETGILEKLSPHSITDPFHPVVRRNRAIRQLLLSDGMSELFKVQVLMKA